jgi:hypothetical protein
MIIPQRREMNQSQDVDNPITERNLITHETQDFSPEIHVLTGILVLVVLTNTWWFSG